MAGVIRLSLSCRTPSATGSATVIGPACWTLFEMAGGGRNVDDQRVQWIPHTIGNLRSWQAQRYRGHGRAGIVLRVYEKAPGYKGVNVDIQELDKIQSLAIQFTQM